MKRLINKIAQRKLAGFLLLMWVGALSDCLNPRDYWYRLKDLKKDITGQLLFQKDPLF